MVAEGPAAAEALSQRAQRAPLAGLGSVVREHHDGHGVCDDGAFILVKILSPPVAADAGFAPGYSTDRKDRKTAATVVTRILKSSQSVQFWT